MVASKHINSNYIVIDAEKCKGCYFCVSVCPKKVIGVATHINQNGYTPAEVVKDQAFECTGCISCAMMCPDAAISVYRQNPTSNRPAS